MTRTRSRVTALLLACTLVLAALFVLPGAALGSGDAASESATETPTEAPAEEPVDEATAEPTETATEEAEPVEETDEATDDDAGVKDPAETDTEADEAESSLQVVSLTAPDSAAPGTTLSVAAAVQNPTDQPVTENLEYRLGGQVVDAELVTVQAGETAVVQLQADTADRDPGQYYHGIFAAESGQVAQISLSESFTLESVGAPSAVSPGETVTVEAEVSNPNDFAANQTVTARLGGSVYAQEAVRLDADASETITFELSTEGLEVDSHVHGVFTREDGEFRTLNVTEEPVEENDTPTEEPVEEPDNETETPTEEPVEEPDNETETPTEKPETPTKTETPTEEPVEEPDNETETPTEKPETPDNETETPTEEPAEDNVTAEANVTFSTDEVTTVVVQEVTVSEGGFLAVHNQTDEGEVGPVIGVSEHLEPGTHENVVVDLYEVPGAEFDQTALEESQTLVAMPHLDTNDNQTFDFVATEGEADGPYTEDGEPVTASAMVQVGPPAEETPTDDADVEEPLTETPTEAPDNETEEPDNETAETETPTEEPVEEPDNETEEPVEDTDTPTEAPAEAPAVTFENQTSNGTAVTVASVTVPEGGFVAIHNGSLIDAEVVESVIGVSEYLEPGTHENVTVHLYDVPGAEFDQTALEESQPLVAMPHLDTNDNQTFDFVATEGEVDGPYTEDGEQVVLAGAIVNVTDAEAPAEETETPTEEPVEEPANETEEPVNETETPELADPADTPTEEPANETEEPANETEEPVDEEPANETEEPANETERPVDEEPANETEEPANETEEPANETEEPENVTQDPGNITEEPVNETETEVAPDGNGPNATVNFTDQTSNGTHVTVENATLEEGGFVAIHRQNDTGEVGPVIGVSEHLEADSAQNVTVRLFNVSGANFTQEALVANQTLVAMPHLDTNDNQTFDFVATEGEADGPYTEDGEPVTDEALVTVSLTADGEAPAEENATETDDAANETDDAANETEDVADNETEDVTNETENVTEDDREEILENETEAGENETEGGADETEDTTNETEDTTNETEETTNETEAIANETGTEAAENETDIEAGENETITVTAEPSVTFENQTSNGTAVTVASVTVPEGGFVAIHNQTDAGEVGPAIGVSEHLETGTHLNVTVHLYNVSGANFTQEALVANQTLVAMPHLDTNDNQTFDFVATEGEADGPYVVDGEVLTDDAFVTVAADATVEANATDETNATEA